jgi:uncharacterized protein (TIGR02466 family)
MNLFAVPVYRSPLGREFTPEEMQFFRQELGQPANAINNHASRNKDVLSAPAMQAIRAQLQQNLDTYFKTIYDTENDVRLEITQSWLTLTRRGQSHHTHSHPNSVVSGVLYINIADDDGINFFRNDDLLWYELIPRQQNYYNAHSMFVKANARDIILFPSHIKHGVREVSTDIERISLAFNTFFSGAMGREGFSNFLRISVNH